MTVAHQAVDAVVDDVELSGRDARKAFEEACKRELDVTAKEFCEAYDRNEIPESWDIAAVARVEFLLPFAR